MRRMAWLSIGIGAGWLLASARRTPPSDRAFRVVPPQPHMETLSTPRKFAAAAVVVGIMLFFLSLLVTLPETWIPVFDDAIPEAILGTAYEVLLLAIVALLAISIAIALAIRVGLSRRNARNLFLAATISVFSTVLLTNLSTGFTVGLGNWSLDVIAVVFILAVSAGALLWTSEVHVAGSRTELGAALVSGALISLFVLVGPQTSVPGDESTAGSQSEGRRLDWARDHLDLRYFDASDMDLQQAYLAHRDFTGAVLERAELVEADLSGSVLHAASLSGANFCGASLVGANMTSARVDEANFSLADLRGTDLREADFGTDGPDYSLFMGVVVNSSTRWPKKFDATQLGSSDSGLLLGEPCGSTSE